jgi:hypothetical protein
VAVQNEFRKKCTEKNQGTGLKGNLWLGRHNLFKPTSEWSQLKEAEDKDNSNTLTMRVGLCCPHIVLMAAEKRSGGTQISGDVAKTVVETVGKKMRTKMRTLAVKVLWPHRRHTS